jgi:exopolysaccharide biosynthesis protein
MLSLIMEELAKVLKKSKKFVFIILLILVSFITIYAGHFLFSEKQQVAEESKKKVEPFPILYKHVSTMISGYKQEIDILQLNPNDKRVNIKPALSYNSLFGFEKLSSIALRNNAYSAVNAGFFYMYGNPSGMVAIDGKIINMSTGKFPVLIMNNGKAELKEVKLRISLSNVQSEIKVDSVNTFNQPKGTIIYTPEFGNDNRINKENISVSIVNNIVTSIDKYSGKVKIPKDGVLLTFLKPYKYNDENFPLKVGDSINLSFSPNLGEKFNAYECGSWIVKAGKVVIGDRDPWVGVMTNHDPRTIVGIRDDGQVIFMTIDGRQPKYSIGMTGKELGDFILSYGINNAAMLDGGASTEMIIRGKIVNRPSDDGRERPVGGGIVVQLTEDG